MPHVSLVLGLCCYATALHVPSTLHASATVSFGIPASVHVRPRCLVFMTKGRAQGGGPAISTRTTKRKTADQRREVVRAKAAAKTAKRLNNKPRTNKLAGLQRQRQQDRHTTLLAKGASPLPVFARVAPALTQVDDSEGWLEVGAVSFASGQGATAAQAAWHHKHFILMHALRCSALSHTSRCLCSLSLPSPSTQTLSSSSPRMNHRLYSKLIPHCPACLHRLYPKLIPHRNALELGLAHSSETTPMLVERCEAIASTSCGFGEIADPNARRSWAERSGSGGKMARSVTP